MALSCVCFTLELSDIILLRCQFYTKESIYVVGDKGCINESHIWLLKRIY